MFRTLLVTMAILTAITSVAFPQTSDTTTNGQRGTSVLFEATVGTRLNGRADGRSLDAPIYVSWELGPLFNRGDWAWGITILGAADDDAEWRWGIRPRYKRHLGSKLAVDLGAGMLLGGKSNYGGPLDPGFAGLVGLSFSNWLGVNLELHTIPTTAYVREDYSPSGSKPPHELSYSYVETEITTWAWILGLRLRGVAGVVFSAIELFLGMAAAASFSGGVAIESTGHST